MLGAYVQPTRHHLREGSTGAELISAMLKVVLSTTWLTGRANRDSSLFSLLGSVPGGTWFLLALGIIHLCALTQPDRSPWLLMRKACASFGLAVWVSLIYDLMQRGATATVILIAPIVVLMAVSIGRRRYAG